MREWMRRLSTRLRVAWTEKLYPTDRWLYLLTFYVVSVLVAGGVLDPDVAVIFSAAFLGSLFGASARARRSPSRLQRWWDRRDSARMTAPLTGPSSMSRPEAAAGWFPDPAGRHEGRYWDGHSWTDYVADRGIVGSAPL